MNTMRIAMTETIPSSTDAVTSAWPAWACLTTLVSASATKKYALASISSPNRSLGIST